MKKSNFIVGMGLGVALGGCMGAMMTPSKKSSKNAIGKTLKAVGEVVDTVSESIGL